jgi:hypothetical protein
MVPVADRLTALRLARLTSLRFVLEALVGEKELFAGRKHKFRAAINALEDAVPVFHCSPLAREQNLQPVFVPYYSLRLVLFVPGLLTCPFAGQCCFDPFFFSGLEIIGMSLYLLDDVLLLNLPLEAAQGVFERFSLLKSYFSQMPFTPVSFTDYL